MKLEIDNVELNYSGKKILSGIYLKAEKGKITGLLGSNGCGKSSLLKIIFGSLKPKNKLLKINNKPCLKPLYVSKNVKYLPQHPLFPKNLYLKEAFHLFDADWEAFISHFPNLKKHFHEQFGKLSGGERRLTEIFLVLNSSSEIILLDEPFTHLSPLYIESISEILQKARQKKAIIITDHMYRHVLDIADEIYLIKDRHSYQITQPSDLENYNYLRQGTLQSF
ncbi:ABC transporter ATP-binding protein [Zunongwangia sp. F260]|uniref:ABC transporter ATP-binding protein n=1 Tax=Autumnicola lenta TaxID=3075593 RepID=A0ABU3CK88_9FLAO|nr:ABC transporter ATP-binding protein [Zunongwangia sp. F260]MDT0646774.1 ABC transporter ATP-binding protein [Zunongwangia sp. F260]